MEAPNVWVVVGLGNPGEAYQATRHNIGFEVVDALVDSWRATPVVFDGPAEVFQADVGEITAYMVKPLTYMNRSGLALATLAVSAEAGAGRHMIVFDDIDLPFGALRFRERGGSGGHKGLTSILDVLGTEEVPRLRMGIGEEERSGDLADYVLAPFSTEEREAVPEWVERAMHGIRVFLEDGPNASMNQFNT